MPKEYKNNKLSWARCLRKKEVAKLSRIKKLMNAK
jgi:hypothetical protein